MMIFILSFLFLFFNNIYCLDTNNEHLPSCDTDKVDVFETILPAPVSLVKWVGDDQQVIFAITTAGELFRSTDAGKTWHSQLYLLTGHQNGIRDLVYMADRQEVVILGAEKRVWVSKQRGASCKK